MSRAITLAAYRLDCDQTARTITGLAVPYGPEAHIGLGSITFASGSIRWPVADLSRVKLLVQHDPDRPVGYALDLTDRPEGLAARFTVPPGAAGDAALSEAGDRLRDGLSLGIDYAKDGLTLEKLGLAGKSPAELARFVHDGA